MKHKTAFVFLLFSALLLHGCVVEDQFSDEGEFDYSIDLDDLDLPYDSYRLWYDEDGSFLLNIVEPFEGEQLKSFYLEGKMSLPVEKLNKSRQSVFSKQGSSCIKMLVFNRNYIEYEREVLMCDEARNTNDFITILNYFDNAFNLGTPTKGPSEVLWQEHEYSLPSSVLTYSQ